MVQLLRNDPYTMDDVHATLRVFKIVIIKFDPDYISITKKVLGANKESLDL